MSADNNLFLQEECLDNMKTGIVITIDSQIGVS